MDTQRGQGIRETETTTSTRGTTMKQDDVIQLAKEAGIEEAFDLKHDQVLVLFKNGSLERFAKLVAEHEREACANVCDDLQAPPHVSDDDMSMWDVTSMECADAIRARGQA